MSKFQTGQRVSFFSDGGAVDNGTIERCFKFFGSEVDCYDVAADRGTTFTLEDRNLTALDTMPYREFKLRMAIKSKLKAEGLSIESNWDDIEACLLKVVAPSSCLRVAAQMKGLEVL